MQARRFCAAFALAAIAATADAATVRVEQGALSGGALPGLDTFFGIPYAAPPVGPLRWRPPQPAASWQGTRPAESFGARCMQQPLYPDMMFRSPGPNEDCLTLNIWAPRGARKLPVLFYVHGGGAVAGDGSEKRYDGAAMARRGIVVVTINYRLGVFGFFTHPELTAESPARASGNYGLMDQAAALNWVKRNIARFGGDPKQITIAGESAGSMSVSLLMVSPLSRDNFARAIGESGAVLPPSFHPATREAAERDGAAFAETIGAPTLAALRALPADQLLAAQGERKLRANMTIDGLFLTEPPMSSFANGRSAKVPLLLGSNSQENGADALLGKGVPVTLDNYRAALKRLYGDQADALLALYPAASDAEVPEAATQLASDKFLAASTWQWFDLHRRTGAPTYYYYYTRIRPPALPPLVNDNPAPIGALHSAEIEYALGNLDVNPLYRWTAEDRQVSATMQGYFTAFIKTGDPNAPDLPRWLPAQPGDGPLPRQHIDVETRSEPFGWQARYVAAVPLLDVGGR